MLSLGTFTSTYEFRNPYVRKDFKEAVPSRTRIGTSRRRIR
jgi:hypothetical protein